ncbi:MAG: tRNA (N(6)-L-threonylcarbamoyladenosine(37)-C(2))-methylthiotransferase MtaB [Clostridia bacterium]
MHCGCKVNQYETDLMMKDFLDVGYEIVDFLNDTDVCVINSCSVTNLSTRKTRQNLSKAKKQGAVVVLAGCYAQELNNEKISNVDIVIGNEEKKDIVNIVNKYIEEKASKKDCKNSIIYRVKDISKVEKYIQNSSLQKGINVRESVKIEDGCNNFCSYCIIPYVRGRVRSRNLEEILLEVKSLVKNGVGEIVLVGIEIASYGKDLKKDISLIDVVEKINKIEGLKRIRLGSIEPRILTEENILRLSKLNKLCHHFHLSVQSLDNRVLHSMNRKYTREDIFKITDCIKKYMPNAAFTCDIIVGFPGETNEEFLNTIEGVKRVSFYEVHAFKYSKRKWTIAADFENQIDGNISQLRSEKLILLAKWQKQKYMEKFLEKKVLVLFEEYKDGYLYGYTSNYIKVKAKGDSNLWGSQVEVELISIENELILGNI